MDILFRDSALADLRRHDRWRRQLTPSAPPIAAEIATAIVTKLQDYDDVDALPYPLTTLRGAVLQAKRCLVVVRSKPFVVFVGPDTDGAIVVTRIRYPRQAPLERSDQA